jgi:hypothetical protein
MRAQGTTIEANLASGYRWYANHVGAVINSAEDLEGAILSIADTTPLAVMVPLDRAMSVVPGFD